MTAKKYPPWWKCLFSILRRFPLGVCVGHSSPKGRAVTVLERMQFPNSSFWEWEAWLFVFLAQLFTMLAFEVSTFSFQAWFSDQQCCPGDRCSCSQSFRQMTPKCWMSFSISVCVNFAFSWRVRWVSLMSWIWKEWCYGKRMINTAEQKAAEQEMCVWDKYYLVIHAK